jgi:hypothetical protein
VEAIMKTRLMVGLATMTILLAAAMPAAADLTISVGCSGDGLSGVQQFTIPYVSGPYTWELASPISIMAGDVRLATIKEMTVDFCDDPYVDLRFAVEAGAVETAFDITTTSAVTFDPLLHPNAYASAGLTLTSDSDGATLTGLFNGKAYRAIYNGSSVYADLVDGYSIGADVTVTHRDRWPDSGHDTILDTVSSIQSEFKFNLSALDQASGTSRFEVTDSFTPEPATMAMLALGGFGVVVARRRRAA